MEAFDNAVSYWEDAADMRVVQDIEEEDDTDDGSRVRRLMIVLYDQILLVLMLTVCTGWSTEN